MEGARIFENDDTFCWVSRQGACQHCKLASFAVQMSLPAESAQHPQYSGGVVLTAVLPRPTVRHPRSRVSN
jgi:hypothetical protein